VPKKQRRPKEEDEEIASDDEEYNSDLGGDDNTLAFSSDEGEEETPQDKRLRLAKQYLSVVIDNAFATWARYLKSARENNEASKQRTEGYKCFGSPANPATWTPGSPDKIPIK